MRRIVLLASLVTAACSPSATCVPGASIACTGPGGCSGGQVCNAAGTAYEACVCGGTDASAPDASVSSDAGASEAGSSDTGGGGADASATPTMGALRVHWSLARGPSVLTCADVAGLDHMEVVVLSAGGTSEHAFPCADGTGTTADLAFGSYEYAVSAVDASGVALGTATTRPITLAASPCDAQLGTTCIRDVSAAVMIF